MPACAAAELPPPGTYDGSVTLRVVMLHDMFILLLRT
jgi:hypothetical protein